MLELSIPHEVGVGGRWEGRREVREGTEGRERRGKRGGESKIRQLPINRL
jgi:hypothetical protein